MTFEEEYMHFIKLTVAVDGWKVADAANKEALKRRQISQLLYSKAARIIAQAYLRS